MPGFPERKKSDAQPPLGRAYAKDEYPHDEPLDRPPLYGSDMVFLPPPDFGNSALQSTVLRT
jgi:hypothetical protein